MAAYMHWLLRESEFYAVFKSPTCVNCKEFDVDYMKKISLFAVEEKTQMRYMEELNSIRAELGVNARLAADTTSENEENYPQLQMTGGKQKKKRKTAVGIQQTPMRGIPLSQEDDAIRPVFSTLQRAEYTPNPSVIVSELTEEFYRTMLIAHKKRRAQRDVS